MSKIIWNTDVNAPGCPGEIIEVLEDGKDGRSILIQTDWDYPAVAIAFGWNMQSVQKTSHVDESDTIQQNIAALHGDPCDHDGTDGTVDCPRCGLTACDFICAAGEWLREHDGGVVDDPGYFTEE